jgi:hypothetical protein
VSSSLRTNGSRECAPDDRLREAIHLAARPDEVWIASSLTLLAMTRSKRRLAIFAVGEARFLQIEIAFDPAAVASMAWNHGGYSLKS